MTRFAPAIVAIGLATALVISGCSTGGLGTPADDPGKGASIADKVYSAVAPVIGEQADAPDSTDVPMVPTPALQRLLAACEEKPEWSFKVRYDARERGAALVYDSFRFRDGSILTFVDRPLPGEGAGTKVEAVEVVRP
jgi:hypothetical protein